MIVVKIVNKINKNMNINKLVIEAMQSKSQALPVLKEIKARFLVYEKSPEGVKNPLDEAIQLDLIKKLKKEHEESLSFLNDNNDIHGEKRKEETFFIDTFNSFLPQEASKEEIASYAMAIVTPGDKKGMGGYIKEVKAKFPSNDGKVIADIVKSIIG